MDSKKVIIKRTFNSPVSKIWDAWTIPSNMKEWFSPEGMTTPEASSDLKVGGKQLIHMTGDKGDFINSGEYKKIEPMKKLVFSWQWKNDPVISVVSIEFKKISANETEVTLTHEFPDKKSVGTHPQGWESTFNKLSKFLK